MFARLFARRDVARMNGKAEEPIATIGEGGRAVDRRGVLRLGGMAAAGAAGAAIATAVNAPPADAANGDNFVVGTYFNAASAPTQLSYDSGSTLQPKYFGLGVGDQAPPTGWADGTPAIGGYAKMHNFATAIEGVGANGATGVVGVSDTGVGVQGTGVAGVIGITQSTTGIAVRGEADSAGGIAVRGSGAGIGVEGACGASGTGVHAINTSNGIGLLAETQLASNTSPAVRAKSGGAGAAIVASTPATATNPAIQSMSGVAGQAAVRALGLAAGTGLALDVHGRALFTRSGVVKIPAGLNNALTPAVLGGLSSASHVLATIQNTATNNVGIGNVIIKAAVPVLSGTNTGKIQVFLTANAAADVNVAWFVFG